MTDPSLKNWMSHTVLRYWKKPEGIHWANQKGTKHDKRLAMDKVKKKKKKSKHAVTQEQ